MPIIERDSWRLQYFAGIACPDDVYVPTDDIDAWRLFPRFRWVYDKLRIAESQGLDCAPHGVAPPAYPVFSKPIVNLRGMGLGSRVLRSALEYEEAHCPGHLWMTLLEGAHVSTDVAVLRGSVRWVRHAVGLAGPAGTFDYWIVEAAPRPALESYCIRWIESHLAGYTGMLNLETIGGRIIEVHLRFADQWPDLNGAGWIDSVVRLYAQGRWEFDDRARVNGYSVVLFGPHGRTYRHPPGAVLDGIRRAERVSSVQIPFDENKRASAHAMPPGGFRLAIVNSRDLQTGMRMRQQLAAAFGVAPTIENAERFS